MEPRYTFFAKWPPKLGDLIDLGTFGDLGFDLTVNLGMVYAPRSGEWEMWLGDPDGVRSAWRPRALDSSPGGFVIGQSRLALDTRAFARGQASHLGFRFNQIIGQTTLSYNQRLAEFCLSDFIPGTAAGVRTLGQIANTVGYDFNSLQCVRVDLDIDGTLRIEASAPTGTLEFDDGSLTARGTLSAYYNPNLGPLAELKAKISGSVALTLGVPEFDYRGVNLKAVAEFSAGTTLPILPNLSFSKSYVLLDKTFGGPGLTGSGNSKNFALKAGPNMQALEVVQKRILSGMPSIPAGETFVANNFVPEKSLEEDAAEAQAAPKSASVGQTNQVLVQNVASATSQALAARNNELMLVYTRPSSPTTQELVWSRFDGTAWSAPLVIPGATSAFILQPTVAYDGNGTVVVVWQQFRTTPAPGSDVAAVTSKLELKWSRFFAGSWSSAQYLTDNTLYDGEPNLCGTLPDGDLLLLSRSSPPGDLFAVQGALVSQRWDSATRTWGAPAVDVAYTGTADFACASGGGKVALVWSVDADANYETTTDSELFYRVFQNGSWGSTTRYTFDTAPDRTPRVALNASGNVFLAWLKNGQLTFAIDFGVPSSIENDSDELGMSDLHLTVGPSGHAVLLWQEPFGRGSDGRYKVYDATAGSWGQSSSLWKDADAERAVRLAWDSSGRLALTYLKERLVSTTQELTAEDANGNPITFTVSNVTEVASVDLAFTKRALLANLTIHAGDFLVADEFFLPGNTVSMTATLSNTGDLAVQNPRLLFSFFPENGSPEIIISNRVFAGWMTAQSTQVFAATWLLPVGITKGRLVARADAANAVFESDESEADNQQSLTRGGTDLVVAFKTKDCYPNGTARVIASVFNAGAPASAAATLYIRRDDGSTVATAPVPSVNPGDTYDVALDLAPGFQTMIFDTYTVGVDPVTVNDSDISNNESRFSIYLPAEYLDPIPVTNGLQLRLTAQAGTSTTLNGAPVASWIDQRNGHEFTNANPVLATYVADSGGGKPALDFTRNSGFIGNFSSTAGAAIGDATVFVVGRFAGYSHPASAASYWFSIDSSTGGSEPTLGRQERGGVGANALFHKGGMAGQNDHFGNNIVEDPAGAFTLYTAVFRNAGGVSAFINGVNGNLANGQANTSYHADPGKTRIGLSTANGDGLDGQIRELVIYNRLLTPTETTQVQDYLARQAAVTMPITILTPPANTGGCPGGTASFFVVPNSESVTYQWQRQLPGGGAFQNISGANAMTYSTPPLSPGDDGTVFRVIVSGTGTNVTSTEASLSVISITAPTMVYDFNNGLPPNTAVYGHAFIDEAAGVLELNTTAASQAGAFLTTDLAPLILVRGFTATFQARVQVGTALPADGFSFNWATDLPNGTYAMAEEGQGAGLRVTFDTWNNGGNEAPAIEVWWGSNLIARRSVSISELVRGLDFFDVQIRLTSDGRLDLTYACEPIFSRLPVTGYTPQMGARFGLAARTGGGWESHSVDNLALQLYSDVTNTTARITRISRQSPTTILIKGTGGPAQSYSIVASTDLETWTSRTNVLTDAGGSWQFVESTVAAPAYRFYRLQAASPFPPGLVSWYRAEGNYRDSFGPNHGTPQGGLALAAGQNGQAFRFDGDASMLIGGTPIPMPWTAAFMVNRQDGPDVSALLLSDSSTALKLEQPSFSRQVGFTQYGVADHYFNHIVPINQWQHLTFVATAMGTQLYVNGALLEVNAASVNLPLHRLGRHENGADRLKGLLDEITLFNRALTPAEVQRLYNTSRGP